MSGFVTRFAPSPTGALHLGHAFSALTAFDAARAAGGRFLLRIEDIDHTRCRPAFDAQICDDLHWLGISWDAPPVRQSARLSRYRAVLERLIEDGLLYQDFRSRRDADAEAVLNAPHGPLPAPEHVEAAPDAATAAAMTAAGQPFSWRLSAPAAMAALGDAGSALHFMDVRAEGPCTVAVDVARYDGAVLARKDIGVSYHIASITDDAEAGITDVIRGEDLRDAAGLHVVLLRLLGLPVPRYHHHRLILGPDGKRLAKRDRAQTLAALRAAGATPATIRETLGLPPRD